MKYIYLFGEVAAIEFPGFISANQTRQMIADARSGDPAEPLTVVLNSFGGDVTEGIAIYNTLRASRPVSIVVSGIAASIASVIAMAGDHVAMYSNSTLFLHHAWTYAEGNAAQMKQRTEELEAADRVLIDAYMAKSGRTEQEIVSLLDGPNGEGGSIDAARALELGLIDEILDPATAVAACLKKSFSASHHKTETNTSASASESGQPQLRSILMAAEPKNKPAPAAECGGEPAKNEEVVETEKEVEETDDDKETRISELEKKVEELTNKLEAANAKLSAQAKFRAVTASAAQTAAQAAKSWPELVKDLGFKAAAEQYPEVRKSYMKAQIAKGSIR